MGAPPNGSPLFLITGFTSSSRVRAGNFPQRRVLYHRFFRTRFRGILCAGTPGSCGSIRRCRPQFRRSRPQRQFNAQWDKKALIIDERFNDGGQIPDRFIEILNRTPLAYWAIRDGESWPWPPYANFGPNVMLINGWSASGGDAFPDYFRKKGLGPLIGNRTWGGLIGISGVPNLIDNGVITAPSFRMYNPDGTWFKEGHGVEPDIFVDEDLAAMAKGIDPQLERAISEIIILMQKQGYKIPPKPAVEPR